ncbi:MAG: cysteine desulfurase family protein [Desulfomonilia bacterium]
MSRSRQIFLDHAATTPVRPDVLGVMLPYFGNHFGNPGSAYELGERSQNALEEARRRVASLIQAHPDEIIFTSGGTESANLAIIGYCLAHREQGRHIITSTIEHNAVLKSCRHLEEMGFEVTFLGVDAHGVIDSAELEGAIRQDTILISVMHGNNETGTLQPASEIGRIARSRNIAFHTDAAQSLGKIPINVDDLGITLLSASSHKIYGPKGVGALYVRRGTALDPMIFGSGQEKGLRPGTVNLPAIVGFGKACELASSELDQYPGTVRTLRDMLQDTILTRITGARILGHPEQRLPHFLCISLPGVEGDSIAAWLDIEGIAVGSGASVFSKSPPTCLLPWASLRSRPSAPSA